MFTRRDFLKTSSLLALAPTVPGLPGPHRAGGGTRARSPRARRPPTRRRQRRPQHRRPVHRPRIREAPPGAQAGPEASDQAQRRSRTAPVAVRFRQAAGAGPARGRARRRLPESEPVALPQHGHLAHRPVRPRGTRRPRLARPRTRRRAETGRRGTIGVPDRRRPAAGRSPRPRSVSPPR